MAQPATPHHRNQNPLRNHARQRTSRHHRLPLRAHNPHRNKNTRQATNKNPTPHTPPMAQSRSNHHHRHQAFRRNKHHRSSNMANKQTNADKQYQAWITKKDKNYSIPAAPIKKWIKQSGLPLEEIGRISGITERSIRRIANEGQKGVKPEVAMRIADALGHNEECYDLLLIEVPGQEGWSKNSTHCVDCGTFFHDHYKDDQCEACYSAHQNGLEQSPVRVAQGDIPLRASLS